MPSENALPNRIVIGGHNTAYFAQLLSSIKKIVPASGAESSAESEYFSGRLVTPEDPSDSSAIRLLLEEDKAAALLLFIEAPSGFIARSLSAGLSIDDAASGWYDVANRLMTLAQTEGERVHLYVAEQVALLPGDFVAKLSGVCGIELSYGGRWPIPERGLWEDFFTLIADQYLEERADLKSLTKVIETNARSLDTGRESTRVDWRRAFNGVEQLREESHLVVDHLYWLQVQYEAALLRLQTEEDRVAEIRSKLVERDRSISDRDRKLKEARQKIDERNRKVEQMRRSLSWRMTLPIRVVSRVLRRLIGK